MEQEHHEKEAAEPLADVQRASGDRSAQGDKTLAELAQQSDAHPNQITDRKTRLMERSAQVFDDRTAKAAEPDIKTLHAKIGQLTLENDFLEHALAKANLLSARR